MADWSVLGDLPGTFFGAMDAGRKRRAEAEEDELFKGLATKILGGDAASSSSSSSTGTTPLNRLGTAPIEEGPPAPPLPPSRPAPSFASGRGAGGGRAMVMPADPEIERRTLETARAGGLTNPYALAVLGSFGQAESGFSPGNVLRTWSDPSVSGKPGTSGGLLSWRDKRYQNMVANGGTATRDPYAATEAQTRFFLKENPKLTAALQNAGSLEEAHELMSQAWAYAGYDKRDGGEYAKRLAGARAYLPKVAGQSAPAAPAGPAAAPPPGFDPAAEIVRLREVATDESVDPQIRATAVAKLKELGTVGSPGASGPTNEAGDRPATRPPGTVGAFAGLPGTDNTIAAPGGAPGGAAAAPAPVPVPAATTAAAPPPPPPRADDQQSRALVALMLRNKSTRAAGLSAMLSMQRKGASAPFPYLDGVAQYDGDGKINWLVEPPKRGQHTLSEGAILTDHNGRTLASNPKTEKPATPHNVPAGSVAIGPTGEVIYANPKDDSGEWERVTSGDQQWWVKKGKSPADGGVLIGPAQARQKELSNYELKQIDDAENERIQLESTLANLKRAKELNPDIYDGFFGGLRTAGATKLSDGLAETFFDPKRGKATTTWNSIMQKEAIEQMASTLKGATTDNELARFVNILADSSQPESVRMETLERMEFLAQKKLELQLKKVEQVRGREFYKPGGGSSDAKPAGDSKPSSPKTTLPIKIPAGMSPAEVARRFASGTKIVLPDGTEGVVP